MNEYQIVNRIDAAKKGNLKEKLNRLDAFIFEKVSFNIFVSICGMLV